MPKQLNDVSDSRLNNTESTFRRIFSENTWGSKESVSGVGSTLEQTCLLIETLPGVLRKLGVKELLDAPCGDFNWMRHVDLSSFKYTGADIVDELISANSVFERPGVSFRKLNVICDTIPRADAIICRDCLVHFSFNDVFRTLANLANSGSEYLLTTTFPGFKRNRDIKTGDWRALNMQALPFCLPKPILLIREGCTEADGIFQNKSLGVWHMQHVARAAGRFRSKANTALHIITRRFI
jgi:hypothetical protein